MNLHIGLLLAFVVVCNAVPTLPRFPFPQMNGRGPFPMMNGGLPPPFFNGGERPPMNPMMRMGMFARHPMKKLFHTCKGDKTMEEIMSNPCPDLPEIAQNIAVLYENATEFLENRAAQMRNFRAAGSEPTEEICNRVLCFKRELVLKVVADGLPEDCEDLLSDDYMPMDMDMMGSMNREERQENKMAMFCNRLDKEVAMIQLAKTADYLGLPEMPRGTRRMMMMMMRAHIKCEGFEEENNPNCDEFNVNQSISTLFGQDWLSWNINIDECKTKMFAALMKGDQDRMCKARLCYGDAMATKIEEENGKMPPMCSQIRSRKADILRLRGHGNTKFMMMQCMQALKHSVRYNISQPTLECTNTEMQERLNQLYSDDDSIVDQAVTEIKNKIQETVAAADGNPSEGITNEKLCRIKTFKEQLKSNNNKLPGFCNDDIAFDNSWEETSIQDIKELLCFKMRKIAKLVEA